MRLFFEDEGFDGQLQRSVGKADSGMANVGECLTIATQITPLERGHAFAAIDGPGQGAMLYEQRVPMRPDWEHVVPELVDALLTRAEVDPARLVLVGRSFGGGQGVV